jgi:hypothetical protein
VDVRLEDGLVHEYVDMLRTNAGMARCAKETRTSVRMRLVSAAVPQVDQRVAEHPHRVVYLTDPVEAKQ